MKRRAIVLMLLACLILVGASARGGDPGFPGEIIKNVTYVWRGWKPLRMTVYVPPPVSKQAPIVMVIHGGGFVGGTRKMMEPFCLAIARQGMVVFSVEYRLAPWSRFPAPMEDVRCALRWIGRHGGEYGGDTDRIGLTGESAGAYLSSMILFPPVDAFCSDCPEGTDVMPEVKAAVLYYGVYDMVKSYDYDFPAIQYMYRAAMGAKLEDDPQGYRDFSPITFLRPDLKLPPTLLIVGDADPLYQETADLYQALTELGQPVEIHVYPGAGHGFAADPEAPPGPENFELTADFFADHLDAPGVDTGND